MNCVLFFHSFLKKREIAFKEPFEVHNFGPIFTQTNWHPSDFDIFVVGWGRQLFLPLVVFDLKCKVFDEKRYTFGTG